MYVCMLGVTVGKLVQLCAALLPAAAESVISIYTAELFPTSVRSTAMGICSQVRQQQSCTHAYVHDTCLMLVCASGKALALHGCMWRCMRQNQEAELACMILS
jgi:hypothetical protein